MSIYGLIILTALLIGFILETLAGYLNSHGLREQPPDRVADLVDGTTWAKTRAYAQARFSLDATASGFKLLALLALWFGGGFPWLDRLIMAWDLGPLGTGAVYIGLILFAFKLVSLPFKIYDTFVVEARFGFNKTTITTFVGDKAKSLLLSVVLGGPFLMALLYFFHFKKEMAWLYCWGTASAFLLFIQYIAPVILMPMFNRFTPLPDGPLRQAILSYAHSIQVPLSNVFSMDGSRRSSRTNAFVTGYGRFRRIVLFDTMIQRHSQEEVVAILAHEVGHYRLHHIFKITLFAVSYLGILCGLLAISMRLPELHSTFYMERVTLHGGLIFFMLLVVPLDLVMSPIMKWLSRYYEYEADRFAATTLPDHKPLISALHRLSVDNLTNLTPHPFHIFMHHTHPPLLARIEAIERSRIGKIE
ncbi:MAG: M48 family metallopeptidase [Magnetococcales bacterium]|nr:M48 family metallopeptidase [Magnetococcales bacterium]